MTYNQYISLFSDIATNHAFVKGFGSGPIDEYLDNNSVTTNGQIVWVDTEASEIVGGIIKDKFTFYVMDFVDKDRTNGNRQEVLSDTKRTLEDIIAQLANDFYSDRFQMEHSATLTDFWDDMFDSEAHGWYCTLIFDSDYVYDACQIPMIEPVNLGEDSGDADPATSFYANENLLIDLLQDPLPEGQRTLNGLYAELSSWITNNSTKTLVSVTNVIGGDGTPGLIIRYY